MISDEEGAPKRVRARARVCAREMTNHLGLGEIKTALEDNGIEKGHRHGHTLEFTRAHTQTRPVHLVSLLLHTHRFLIHTHPCLGPAPACWSPRWLAATGRHGTGLWAPALDVRMRWLLRD